MRALYFKQEVLDQIKIEGEDFHHIVNVARLKEKDNILLIHGNGKGSLCYISEIFAKSLDLVFIKTVNQEKKYKVDLFCSIVKKDALAEVVKKATELGVSSIYFFKSKNSQNYQINEKRMDSLLKSAVEQSNNFYPPILEKVLTWEDFIRKFSDYSSKIVMDNSSQSLAQKEVLNLNSISLAVGPEGGFSSEEINEFVDIGSYCLSLPTPIQRAPTAVCSGMGFILTQID